MTLAIERIFAVILHLFRKEGTEYRFIKHVRLEKKHLPKTSHMGRSPKLIAFM